VMARGRKVYLLIILGIGIVVFQLWAVVFLTNHTSLALSLCILVSCVPFAAFMIFAAAGRVCSGRKKVSDEAGGGGAVKAERQGLWGLVKEDVLSAGFIAAVLCILFHQSLLPGRGLTSADGIYMWPPWREGYQGRVSNYPLADQYLCFNPQQHVIQQQMCRGRIGLWNPYLSCGVPLAGSMQSAVFFPLNLAFSYFSPFRAAVFKSFLKLFLAGVFMLLYMKRLGVGCWGRLLSAMVYSLSSFMIVWLGHPHTNCAMLLPLLLYIIEGEFCGQRPAVSDKPDRPGGLRRWAAFSVVYGFMILGGHPPTIIHISIVIFVYFCFRLISQRKDGVIGRRILFFAFGIIFGALLAAVQILPFLEYYRVSSVPAGSVLLSRWSHHLHISALVGFFMPYIGGSPVHGFEWLMRFANGQYNFSERVMFVSLLGLCLPVFAVFYRRNRIVIFYLVLMLFCLCTIFGLWPILSAIRYIPIVNNINNIRLILIVCFSLAVLGGFGLEGLGRLRFTARWKVLFGLWLVFGGFLFWIFSCFEHILFGQDQDVGRFILTQMHVFAASAAVLSLVILYPRRRSRLLPKIIAVGWVSFELLWFGMGYNPSISRGQYYPVTGGIRFLQQDDSLFRVASLDGVLPPNTASMYGLYDIRGRDFMTVRRYEQFIKGSAGDFFFYSPLDALPSRPQDINVKYLLADKNRIMPQEPVYQDEVSIYQMESFLDRAFVVFDYEVVDNEADVLKTVRSESFEPREKVILERQPREAGAGPGSSEPAVAEARVIEYDCDAVTIEVSVDRQGFVVLCDTYFPGWKSYVNGRQRPVYRANYNFRAVRIPEGDSIVRFEYRPASFTAGSCVSVSCMMFLIFLGFVPGRKRLWRPGGKEQAL